MESKSYFVGVDIGTSNVVMVVGSRKGSGGAIEIEGVSSQEIESGVSAGRIDNINTVGVAIRKAKEELEEELHICINEAYAGISSESVRCAYYTDHVFVKDSTSNCISKEDVASLHERMYNVHADSGEEIIARIPQNYVIDEGREIEDPVGSFGHTLSSTFMFILCPKSQLERVRMSFFNAGLKPPLAVRVNPCELPRTLLSQEEREEGVVIVDIGGGTTDVSVTRGGKLRYIATVPIGAQSINADMHAFGIFESKTESIKKRYGSAVADMVEADSVIPMALAGMHKRDFPQRNLVSIIEARLKDIVEYAMAEVKYAKMTSKVPCGFVITGGCSTLENIDELFRRETKLPARLGGAKEGVTEGSLDNISTFAHSAAVAVMLYGATCQACNVTAQRGAVPVQPQPHSQTVRGPQPSVTTQRPVAEVPKSAEVPVTEVAEVKGPATLTGEVTDEGDTTSKVESQEQRPEERNTEGNKSKKGNKGPGLFSRAWHGIARTVNMIVGNEEDGNDIL
ncbi:MAG: cell division protein FtsA [Alistipes sp.]|nr:cell division protein FtsA [Alistipes sp.]